MGARVRILSPASSIMLKKMVKKTGPTDINLRKLVSELRKAANKEKANIWKRVADELSKASRQRACANLGKINKVCSNNETVLVPGKVMAHGKLDKKLTIAAWKFTDNVKHNAKNAKLLTIQELMKTNPKGSKVRLIK